MYCPSPELILLNPEINLPELKQPNFSHNLIVISDIKRTTLGGGHVILYCPSPELILLNPGINQFQDSIAFN